MGYSPRKRLTQSGCNGLTDLPIQAPCGERNQRIFTPVGIRNHLRFRSFRAFVSEGQYVAKLLKRQPSQPRLQAHSRVGNIKQ